MSCASATLAAQGSLASGFALGIALVLCVIGAPSRAYARPSQHVSLQLTAPASCPTSQQLLERIDQQLGAELVTDTELRADAQVRALGPSDFELRLRYETSSGAVEERELRGESCAAVSDAAMLVLALVLNPSALGPSAAEAAAGEVHAPEPASVAARLAVLAALDSALLARVSGAVALQLGLRVGWLELHARAQLFPPREAALEETAARFNAYSFDLLACVPWQLGRLSAGPCVRGEVGRLAAKVSGPIAAQTPGAARFQALALGAEARVRIAAPLWLSLSADLAWFLRRPQFVVTDLGEVLRPSKLGMRAYVGPLLAW